MDSNDKDLSSKSVLWTLTLVGLVLVAIGISWMRYFHNPQYPVTLYIECNPALEICTTDEEDYYKKIVVRANTLNELCGALDEDACGELLLAQHIADVTFPLCEDNLKEWEYCTNPNEWVLEQDEGAMIEESAMPYGGESEIQETGQFIENQEVMNMESQVEFIVD